MARGALGIHTADCAVPSISWHLSHTILGSDSTLQKLNQLAEVMDGLNTAGLYHLSKSLDPEFQLGTDSLAEDGVRRTEFGLVRRLSKPFPELEIGQAMM